MSGYGQFCPVAKAMEVLDERWTVLVVRELLLGSRHFNELRRGVPRMSPTLLARRLRSLERVGVVRRTQTGRTVSYDLTDAGRDLLTVVEDIGRWGARWVGHLGEEDLDPHLLLWDVRRTLRPEDWPPGRTVVALTFTDTARGAAKWWVVVTPEGVDACDADPGFAVTAEVATTLRALTRVWRGDVTWTGAVRTGDIRVSGPSEVRRDLAGWWGTSRLAQPGWRPAGAPGWSAL